MRSRFYGLYINDNGEFFSIHIGNAPPAIKGDVFTKTGDMDTLHIFNNFYFSLNYYCPAIGYYFMRSYKLQSFKGAVISTSNPGYHDTVFLMVNYFLQS